MFDCRYKLRGIKPSFFMGYYDLPEEGLEANIYRVRVDSIWKLLLKIF